MSCLHLLDLANRSEIEARKDLDAFYDLLKVLSVAANDNGAFESASSPNKTSPNDFLRMSNVARDVVDSLDERTRRPLCKLRIFFSPVILG